MKIEVLEEKENPLLDRKEIVAKIIHDDSTPSRDVIRSKAIAKLKAKKDTFILDSIKTTFGAKESISYMRIYGSKSRVLEIESDHVLRKNSLISQEAEKKEEKVKKKPAKEGIEEGKPKVEKKKPLKETKEKPVKEEKAEGEEKKSSIKEKKPQKRQTKKGKESKEKEETSTKEDKTKEEST